MRGGYYFYGSFEGGGFMNQGSPIGTLTNDEVPLSYKHHKNHFWRNEKWKKNMKKTSRFLEAF